MVRVSARPPERVHGRHAGDVYRLALALLQEPREAEIVARAVLARADRELDGARRDARTWMIDAAHASCRARSATEATAPTHATTTCAEAVALSRDIDGLLARREARVLRAHLGQCLDCEVWARSLRSQRRAFRSLTLESAPSSLRL